MKILFIQPSCLVSERWADRIVPFLPIGLGSLAATLRTQGHEVTIVDALTEGWDLHGRIEGNLIEIGLTEEEIAAKVRQFRPQVVGFSIPFTTQMPRLRSLARWVKAIHPEILTICGGNHPTAAPCEVLSIPEVDIVVLGEGEVVLSHLIDKLSSGLPYDDLDGIAFRDQSGQVRVHPSEEFNQNLDALPLPAYDLLPLKKFFRALDKRSMPLFSSRGCTGTCAHCSSQHIFGYKDRRFSARYLINHIRHLVEYYGVREFSFDDDALLADRSKGEELFSQLISENLRIQWVARSGQHYDVLDELFLKVMKLSGARRLHFAPKSGSRRVLRRILKRPSDLFTLEQAVLRTLSSGIKVTCNFTIGLPGETIEEVYETLNYAWKLRSLGVDEFSFSLATPYIGTQLREIAYKNNCLLDVSEAMYTPNETCLTTNEFTSDEIVNIRDTAEREFNARGLIIGLPRRTNPTKRSSISSEDRFFFSVAPQSVLLNTANLQSVPLSVSREAV